MTTQELQNTKELQPIITFGKYKNKSIDFILENNINYAKWLFEHPKIVLNDDINKILDEKFKDKNEHYLTFGRYKNKSLSWIRQNDEKYIDYLKNNEFVKTKLPNLYIAL